MPKFRCECVKRIQIYFMTTAILPDPFSLKIIRIIKSVKTFKIREEWQRKNISKASHFSKANTALKTWSINITISSIVHMECWLNSASLERNRCGLYSTKENYMLLKIYPHFFLSVGKIWVQYQIFDIIFTIKILQVFLQSLKAIHFFNCLFKLTTKRYTVIILPVFWQLLLRN